MARTFKKGDRLLVLARTDTYRREVGFEGKDVYLTVPSFKGDNVGPNLTWASADIVENRHSNNRSEASVTKAPPRSVSAKFPDTAADYEVF